MENKINSKVHEKLDSWMSKLDQFQLELSLGKMEVKDEFAKEKKQLHDYFQEYIQSVEHFKNVASEKAEELKHTFNDFKKELQKEEEITEKSLIKHKNAIGDFLNKMTSI